MANLINEAKRFQKLAGLLKEEVSPEEIEFKGTDGVLQVKLYIDGYAKGFSILEACIGNKQIFCIKDSTSFLKERFNKMKNLEPMKKRNYTTGEEKETKTSEEELNRMKCEEIFSKLFSLYLSGHVFDHHGSKTQQSFKCGDFSKGFGRQGY